MFGATHIIYMVVSAIVSISVLILLHFMAKEDGQKLFALRFFAIITVIIHYSSLWVEYFKNGEAIADSSMLLTVYPCNICMWLLLALSFIKDKNSLMFKLISEFLFFGGTVCGIIGIVLNENFGSNPTLLDYHVLKGMLSHSTMVLGCIYILVGGFIKIRVSNVVSVAAGLSFFVLNGIVINTLYSVFDLPPCNSMYLLEPPFPDMPWLNTVAIGIAGVLITFTVSAIYELMALPKEERWYNVIKEKFNERRGTT